MGKQKRVSYLFGHPHGEKGKNRRTTEACFPKKTDKTKMLLWGHKP